MKAIVIEIIKNNLVIFISTSIAILSACFNVYQYISNKQLKKYNVEKELKKKKADLEKLQKDRNCNGELYLIGINDKRINDFECKEKHLIAEIEYLEKILNKK